MRTVADCLSDSLQTVEAVRFVAFSEDAAEVVERVLGEITERG